VELAPLTEPALVTPAIATAVGVREKPGEPLLSTLQSALHARQVLLLLDNCEHLLDACAQHVDALLRACPDLQVLATSREALGISGEQSWLAPSLPLPEETATPAVALQAAAVQLFVERAQAVLPSFALSSQNVAAVVQVCRRLDGIPLALELAAACLRSLSPQQLATRLDQRFQLLVGGSRAALPRQQTLRAMVDWSYHRLSEGEQRLFRQLSVFVGDCTLEAVEAVGSGEGIEQQQVAPLLARLVEQSLVLAEGQVDGEERYRLLETLRQYGWEELVAAGEAPAAAERHAAYYLGWAEEAAPQSEVGHREPGAGGGALRQRVRQPAVGLALADPAPGRRTGSSTRPGALLLLGNARRAPGDRTGPAGAEPGALPTTRRPAARRLAVRSAGRGGPCAR